MHSLFQLCAFRHGYQWWHWMLACHRHQRRVATWCLRMRRWFKIPQLSLEMKHSNWKRTKLFPLLMPLVLSTAPSKSKWWRDSHSRRLTLIHHGLEIYRYLHLDIDCTVHEKCSCNFRSIRFFGWATPQREEIMAQWTAFSMPLTILMM